MRRTVCIHSYEYFLQ